MQADLQNHFHLGSQWEEQGSSEHAYLLLYLKNDQSSSAELQLFLTCIFFTFRQSLQLPRARAAPWFHWNPVIPFLQLLHESFLCSMTFPLWMHCFSNHHPQGAGWLRAAGGAPGLQLLPACKDNQGALKALLPHISLESCSFGCHRATLVLSMSEEVSQNNFWDIVCTKK